MHRWPPRLEKEFDPGGDDHRVTADPVELAQQGQAILAMVDVGKQLHADDAVHRVGRQPDIERRAVEGLDPLQQAGRMMGLGMVQHVLGWIRREDHPVAMLGQQRPVATGATGHVEDQSRLAGDLQRMAYQVRHAPQPESRAHPGRTRLTADARVFLVVTPSELQLDGRWGVGRHGG